jgi:RES domain-containing protein
MLVYRITGKKYAHDLSGTGAALFGGRWNRKGTPVLYTGENREIALLETVVHTPPLLIPALDLLMLEIPDDSITELTENELPKNWQNYPAPAILAELGENWVQAGKTIALKVPSCIIPAAHNYILNCRHPEYARVKLIERTDFRFDGRLVK